MPTVKLSNNGATLTGTITDEEYADLIASGWTLEPQEETPTE